VIEYKTGNILDDDAEALVNPVNCVGIMGRGLALTCSPSNLLLCCISIVISNLILTASDYDDILEIMLVFQMRDHEIHHNISLYYILELTMSVMLLALNHSKDFS
jgi:hypothetical protein